MKGSIARVSIVLIVGVMAVSAAGAAPLPATPFTQDPLGPISDVTASAAAYQPADLFCVRPDVYQIAGPGEKTTSADPACANSGFPANWPGLVKIRVQTPSLCDGCRRIFIDYSKIGPNDGNNFYAHGHAYFHLTSLTPGYAVDPVAHSPNIKNFTNDKLFVPDGSPQELPVSTADTYAIAFTGNTAHTVYSVAQGPYYAGSWYLNQEGVRIYGSYLDVQPSPFPQVPEDGIGYGAGFYSGDITCPNSLNGETADGDGYYGGCADRFGFSSTRV